MTSQVYNLDGPKEFPFPYPVRAAAQLTVEIVPGNIVSPGDYEVVGVGPTSTQVTVRYPNAPTTGGLQLKISRYVAPERVTVIDDPSDITTVNLNAEFNNIYEALIDFEEFILNLVQQMLDDFQNDVLDPALAEITQARDDAVAAKDAAEAAQQGAEEAEQGATAAWDAFQDRYWGAYPTDPSVSPVGNPPTAGDLYWNTTVNQWRAWDANQGAWVSVTSAVPTYYDRRNYIATEGQTTFEATYDAGFVQVWVNGLLLPPSDYEASTGTEVVLDEGVAAGTEVTIVGLGAVAVGVLDGNDATVTTSTGTQLLPEALDKRVVHVPDLPALRAMTGMQEGQATQITTTGRAGLFRWQSGDLSAECDADPQMGIYVPPTGQDGSLGAWVRQYGQAVQINPFVEVRWFGALGDGVTDDSTAFIAARGDISSPRTIEVGAPDVAYVLANFQMGAGCTLRGLGKEVSRIVGNGSDPVILFGDGVDRLLRDNEMYDVRIENDGAPCVVGRLSPNWKIRRCFIRSTSGDGTFNTVDFRLSFRGDFSENESGIGGAGWGLSLLDNCNGQTVHHNQWSSGAAGGTIRAGTCYGLSIKHNIIESSLDGIYVASTSDPEDGNCYGVEIDNNYFEQCRNPFVLGTVRSVIGWSLKNNYVGNQNQNSIPARDATFKLGRVRHGELSGNSVYLADDGSENLFELNIRTLNDIYGNVFRRGSVRGTAANEVLLSGDFATSTSALRYLGGQNFFDFIGSLSSTEAREYVTDTISADVGKSTYSWLQGSVPVYGGQLVSAEIIEAEGDLTGATLRIGDTGDHTRAYLNNDLATLTFSDGHADLPLSDTLLIGQPSGPPTRNNLLGVGAGTGTGTFRVRIRYRAT